MENRSNPKKIHQGASAAIETAAVVVPVESLVEVPVIAEPEVEQMIKTEVESTVTSPEVKSSQPKRTIDNILARLPDLQQLSEDQKTILATALMETTIEPESVIGAAIRETEIGIVTADGAHRFLNR